MKTSFRTTLAAAAFAIASAANFASLPSAALTVAVQASPWLGLGAGLVVSGEVFAATKDIPSIGIRVRKNPGGTARTAPVKTANDGSFHFSGLEAGDYEVTPDGGKAVIFKVGSDGKLSGMVQENGAVQTKPSVQSLRPCPNRENDPCDYLFGHSPASSAKSIAVPAPSTDSKKCPTGYTWSGGDVCTNAKGIRTSTI